MKEGLASVMGKIPLIQRDQSVSKELNYVVEQSSRIFIGIKKCSNQSGKTQNSRHLINYTACKAAGKYNP